MIQRSDTNKNDNNDFNNVKEDKPPRTFTPYKSSGLNTGAKKTQFHNFEQNNYDFDALEQYLLERSRQKL